MSTNSPTQSEWLTYDEFAGPEAKSEAKPDGELAANDVRQASSHLRS